MDSPMRKLVLSTVLTMMFSTMACVFSNNEPVGETVTESKAVQLGGAKSVQVQIKMGAGELKVEGGASNLMNADFTYNVPRWKPEVRYDASGGTGQLTIQQPPGSRGHGGRTRYEWDLRFNNQVPMEMNIDQGAGSANLDLAGLALSNLKVNIGAGETTINLDGKWKNDLAASIHGGVGQAMLKLPRDVGVHVVAHGGLGAINASGFSKQGDAYVNDAYGKSPVTLHIEVEGGVGEINLEMGGSSGTV
jgi:N-terminal domain of toast_rack, DUF2154